MRSAPAATRGSSSSARGGRTRPRWSSSSWSDSRTPARGGSAPMSTARLRIAYDGRGFAGWAAQPERRTVQGELEAALGRILGERVTLTVAGRTDAGVHASAQVASFEHAAELPDRLAERLNGVLPRDVAVQAAGPAPDGFDARRSARSRTYRYRVLASPIRDPFEEGRALWWRHPLDRALLDACAEAVVGSHDFTAFTPTQTEHVLFVRDVLRCEWSQERRPSVDPPIPGMSTAVPTGAAGGMSEDQRAQEMGGTLLALQIESEAFMRSQVRVVVGTMLEVAARRRTLADFRALLDGAPRERAGETAPAHGLCLVAVSY
ncbi:MAG: tRNA pseudouridine(38-40) synthase TruA [Solirubrobacterales bacterium]|nr:tRNA pseudouridine(38-40) synthase TruA [Solirubrobacterales bacterium]